MRKADPVGLSNPRRPARRGGVRTTQEREHVMAEYLILIYEREDEYAAATPDVFREVMEAHNRFGEQYGSKIRGGKALQDTHAATTIRNDVVTDGPFVETKEVLGGYYLVEANDLDEALEIAKHCPAPFGGVEVRPIQVFE
jgi:hypothetical protein